MGMEKTKDVENVWENGARELGRRRKLFIYYSRSFSFAKCEWEKKSGSSSKSQFPFNSSDQQQAACFSLSEFSCFPML